MSAADRMVHLAGYGAITGVLGTATWASQSGRYIALLFVGLVVLNLGALLVQGVTIGQSADAEEGESA